MMKKLTSFTLAVLLLLSTGITCMAEDKYYEKETYHANVAFEDMEYETFDSQPVWDHLNALKEALAKGEEADAIEEKLVLVQKDKVKFDSVLSIYQIRYYSDVTDEALSDTFNAYTEEYYRYADAVSEAIANGMQSASRAVFVKYYGDGEEYEDFEPMSEDELALLNEETELITQYNDVYVAGYEEDSKTAYNEWYEELARIYIKLLENRKKQLTFMDYDSYMEYCYDSVYYRDYSVEEAKAYREYVKEYLVPLYADIYQELVYVDGYMELVTMDGPSVEEKLSALGDHLEGIHPELMEAYDYMLTYKLYDIGTSETKANTGFTIMLYEYGSPFFFDSPYESYFDYSTMFHEFGHYNRAYHTEYILGEDTDCYDVSEIHSQALEMLSLKYAKEIFGEECEDAVPLEFVYRMLSAVVDGCMYDEFQERAFDLENPSVDDLTRLMAELSEDYGYDLSLSEAKEWVEISHNFESPFYYISYSTSALAALEIYVQSLKDYDLAVDTYMRLSALPLGMGFVESLEAVGLDNIFESDTITSIVDTFDETYVGLYSGPALIKQIMMFCVGIGVILLIIILLVATILKARKKKAFLEQERQRLEEQRYLDAREEQKNNQENIWRG